MYRILARDTGISFTEWMGCGALSVFGHIVIAVIIFVYSGRPVLNVPAIDNEPRIYVDLVEFDPRTPVFSNRTQPGKETSIKEEASARPLKPEQGGATPGAGPAKRIIGPKNDLVKKSRLKAKPPVPVVKESLKAKTFKPERLIEAAVKRIEKEAKAGRPSAVEKKIEQIEKNIQKQVAVPAPKSAARAGDAPQDGIDPSGYDSMDIYKAEIQVKLKSNWVFPERLAKDAKGLETRLMVMISKDGRISDVWYDKMSGNRFLDESAYRAVMKSNPLPPLPDGYNRPFFSLMIVFTPRGVSF